MHSDAGLGILELIPRQSPRATADLVIMLDALCEGVLALSGFYCVVPSS